jgi:serine O-acetyltransferase
MNKYIKSDLMRYYGKVDCLTFIKAIFRSKTFRFQVIFRMCNGGVLLNL